MLGHGTQARQRSIGEQTLGSLVNKEQQMETGFFATYVIEGVGEVGLDPDHSPGVGPYYVKLYDGSYDASGFDTEREARLELEYLTQ